MTGPRSRWTGIPRYPEHRQSARKEREAGATSMEDITTRRRSNLDEHEHVMVY
jgi:hypothetical protein